MVQGQRPTAPGVPDLPEMQRQPRWECSFWVTRKSSGEEKAGLTQGAKQGPAPNAAPLPVKGRQEGE